MYANAKLDAALERKAGVSLYHSVLHLDCTPNGINHAAKLDDASIAGAFHHAPLMHGDCRVYQTLRSARSRANVRSSSEPASLLYPTTSATKIATSFRVSTTARLATLGY